MPSLKEARYAVERSAGKAIDADPQTERNSLMHESAAPLAQLYSPLFLVDDTFVLHEYFCPYKKFGAWVRLAKPAFERAASLHLLNLLNTTVRFVHCDTVTALPYASSPGGSFAFVIYFRIERSAEADAQLKIVHEMLTAVSLELGGESSRCIRVLTQRYAQPNTMLNRTLHTVLRTQPAA